MKNAGHFRWVIIGLIAFITIVNYIDRSAISYAISPIEAAFHMSNAEFGIIGAAFGLGYFPMTFLGGILIDLYGVKRVWLISALIWSVATLFLGFSNGFWWFFSFRVLLGMSEGPHFPAVVRATSDWLPLKERAKALSYSLSGVTLASLIGAPVVTLLIENFGWREMFFVLGGVGILWAIAAKFLFANRPEESPLISKDELKLIQASHPKEQPKLKNIPWKFLFTNPALLINHITFFTMGYTIFFALTWLPGFLQQTYGITLKTAGFLVMIPWLFSFLMMIASGYLSDWILKKTNSARMARSNVMWLSQLISILSFLPLAFQSDLTLCIILLSLGLGFTFVLYNTLFALNADLGKRHSGTAQGIGSAAFSLAGIVSPIVTGYLSDLSGNFNSAIFCLLGFSLVSVVLILFFQHPDKYLAPQAAASENS